MNSAARALTKENSTKQAPTAAAQGQDLTRTDSPPGRISAAGPRVRGRWIALAVLAMADFVVILDSSIVNVALPSIGRALNLAPGDLSWVVNAYVLTFGGFLLLGGRLADLLGRRRVFISSLVVFSLASLAGGLALSGPQLVASRAVQGLAAGVLLGGVLTTSLGWRWVLFVNVPVGVGCALAAPRLIAESRPPRDGLRFDQRSQHRRRRPGRLATRPPAAADGDQRARHIRGRRRPAPPRQASRFGGGRRFDRRHRGGPVPAGSPRHPRQRNTRTAEWRQRVERPA